MAKCDSCGQCVQLVTQQFDDLITAIGGGGGGSTLDAERVAYQAVRNGAGYSIGDQLGKYFVTDPSVPALVSVLCLNETTGIPIAVPPAVDIEGVDTLRISPIRTAWLNVTDAAVVDLSTAVASTFDATLVGVPAEAIGATLEAQFASGGAGRFLTGGATPPANAPTAFGHIITNGNQVRLGKVPLFGTQGSDETELSPTGFRVIMENFIAGDGFMITYYKIGP